MFWMSLQGLVEYGAVQPRTAPEPAGSGVPQPLREAWGWVVDEPLLGLLVLATVVLLWALFRSRPERL